MWRRRLILNPVVSGRSGPVARRAVWVPSGGRVLGEGEQLSPSGELAGQGDDGAPDHALGEVVQRQVGKPGVLGGADAVHGAGPAAMPQFEVGELTPRPPGGVLVAKAV